MLGFLTALFIDKKARKALEERRRALAAGAGSKSKALAPVRPQAPVKSQPPTQAAKPQAPAQAQLPAPAAAKAAPPSLEPPASNAREQALAQVREQSEQLVTPERAELLRSAMNIHRAKQFILDQLTDEERTRLVAMAVSKLMKEGREPDSL